MHFRFLTLLCGTAQQRYCHVEGVCHPSSPGRPLDLVFLDTAKSVNDKFGGKVPIHHMHISTCSRLSFVVIVFQKFSFLALLDYVMRANEIAICPSSFVRPSSVRVAIISELYAQITFKF